MRAARSLKYPNGAGTPWIWTKRGIEINGQLRARTNNLKKHHLSIHYDPKTNKYYISDMMSHKDIQVLTRQEVDKLNIKYGKLAAFA